MTVKTNKTQHILYHLVGVGSYIMVLHLGIATSFVTSPEHVGRSALVELTIVSVSAVNKDIA